MDRDEMISKIRALAEEIGSKKIPRHMYLRRTRLSERKISKIFGSYNGLVEAAGLTPVPFPTSEQPAFTDEKILAEIMRVLRLPDSKMTRIYFEQQGAISPSVCERRFGGWINALRTAQKLLDSVLDKELIDKMTEYTTPRMVNTKQIQGVEKEVSERGGAIVENDMDVNAVSKEPIIGHQYIETDTTNIYGDFINFRGLQHAPLNEQGVVFLFGMICRELGYVVEIVKPGFPDCEAKRIIRGKSGKWQRVRIEFEYSSRNFKTHGHDPDLCDIIVCWEHDWIDCPIEILELKSIIRTIPGAV